MRKLYYSVIIFLVVFVGGLMLPKTKAAGEFDDTAHYIGFIEGYERDGNGYIIGAWVYIEKSSLPKGDYSVYYFFNPAYFQPDILVLQDELIGKRLIWNSFDNRASDYGYNGAWWLLVGYEYISDDIDDAYQYGYESGYNKGYSDGEEIGYTNGYLDGQQSGFNDGYSVGYEDGEQLGYTNGYGDGHNDGREQVLNSIGEIGEILFQDIVLPNGVKDEIINNEILVDRVGVVVFDGFEDWQRYNFDVEPYSTVAFILILGLSLEYDRYRHYISNILDNGSVWNMDNANMMHLTEQGSVLVRLSKSDLVAYGYDEGMTDQQKVNTFKQWLAAQKDAGEPLTLWYQYAEPKEYDLVPLLTNADGSFVDGYNKGYNEGRVHVQKENKSLLSVIPTTIGSIWLMISDFLSFEVFGINVWSIIIIFASFSLLVLLIKMVI